MNSSGKRQWLVIGIAGLCLVFAGWSLFSGNDSASAPAPPVEAASAPDSPSEPPPTPQLEPAMYQRLRDQLMRFPAEHQEPFRDLRTMVVQTANANRTQDRGIEPSPSPNTPPFLPVPPLTVQPAPQDTSEQEQSISNSPSADTSPTIRLRGVVRNRETRQVNALLEVNGQIVLASQEPHAEWHIVTLTPKQLVVRHHHKTYTVEVSNAK